MTVSACIITYNQEKYIKETLEGAIAQSVNFDYEIVINDDCSTDTTSEICKSYANKYPKLITYIRQDKNLGMIENVKKSINACKGKYIALCEGDDYWTDPLKLQKQVDFLEANVDYNICFHNVKVYNQSLRKFQNDTIARNVSETTNILDLAQGNYIHTPSVMLRNNFTLPHWFSTCPLGDWSLYMIAIGDKKIKKLSDTMAVYRVNDQGIWAKTSQKNRMENTVKSYKKVLNNLSLKDEVKKIMTNRINKLSKNLNKSSKSSVVQRIINKYF